MINLGDMRVGTHEASDPPPQTQEGSLPVMHGQFQQPLDPLVNSKVV